MTHGIPYPSDSEFLKYQRLIEESTGIFLPPHKKTLLNNRLSKRLVERSCKNFSEYFSLISDSGESHELEMALELITTNETYFFREPKHFDFLNKVLQQRQGDTKTFRVWCAAASTGEEPYTIAMILSESCSSPWELVASDVNEKVLEHAYKAIYRDDRLSGVSPAFMDKYFLHGIGKYQSHVRITPELRYRVKFLKVNLMHDFTGMGKFDAIFIRNVMIYFERETQIKVMQRISKCIKPNGYVFVGHSESLHGVDKEFRMRCPAVYQYGV
ncbi:CheR family methyltransferase [Teredinibacter sp. KSP-S5-2]|uniref:CheR family methyltransferase n=1 Tax=Teredinibacter sp. KSP-S5-2 TaxID=3034506 RepID=UPI00293458C0|nr:CheR family methyltransferase [Teredinibacter sp. KSP-S5-2]WNO10185.1 CheR family methyltransferase [Teredinibacter sp. KSP-S5-2]